MTRKIRSVALAAALLAACRPQERAPAAAPGHDTLASCGTLEPLRTTLGAEVAQGRALENSRQGQCVVKAATDGSTAAAMLLADMYGGTMAQIGGGGAAALRLDLFGRHMRWLRRAAELGYAPAQWRLAQEADGPAYAPMASETLAWYQTAAENGSLPAFQSVGTAYAKGRITDERLYDLRKWLAGRAAGSAACRDVLRRLNKPPRHFL